MTSVSGGSSAVATLGTQPSVVLESWDPAHIETLRFNPCKTDDPAYEKMEWSKGNLKDKCRVDAKQCAFCAWVLQFDSEYRVNDIVTCLGPTYKMAAEAVVNEAKFSGTILQRMLAAKGKKPDGTINWPADKFQEARDNFRWMIQAIGNEWCDVPDHRTLVVHIRAGDNLNDDFKNIPHIPAAIQQMKDYLTHRPYITRIELSSVLHFGVPAPDSQFQYNDGVGDAYVMSDEALRKNGLILGHFYEAALSTGRGRVVHQHERPGPGHVPIRQGLPFPHRVALQAGDDVRGAHGAAPVVFRARARPAQAPLHVRRARHRRVGQRRGARHRGDGQG